MGVNEPLDPEVHEAHEAQAAPPTVRGQMLRAKRPAVWPGVLSVIAIIFGAAATLGGLLGFVAPLITDFMAGVVPGSGMAGQAQAFKDWRWFQLGLTVVTFGLGVMLLVGGIALSKRRPWAPRLIVYWAIAKILLVVGSASLAHLLQRATFEDMQSQMANAPVPAQAMFGAIGIISVIVTLLWGWALPIVMLFWFARKPVKEEVGSWAENVTAHQEAP